MLECGRIGLGFGCGREPLVGLLAKFGCKVTATDLETEAARQRGWVSTNQHTSSREALYEVASEYVSGNLFDSNVKFQYLDMNAIPDELHDQFDFAWSACALEHLGSLRRGVEFVKNSVRCLKPGGIAVHTTEFNLSSNEETLESLGCSVYRERDIRELIEELREAGFEVAPLNLNTGDGRVDKHVDLPPYGFSPHIKLMLEGFVVTSIGFIIRRPKT